MIVTDVTMLRQPSKPMDPHNRGAMESIRQRLEREIERLERLQRLQREIPQQKAVVGLAAPQVGRKHRAFMIQVYDGLNDKFEWWFVVNPRILSRTDGIVENTEGCMSLPNLQVVVTRSRQITVQDNYDGGTYVLTGDEAVIFQHELDHLDGILIQDRQSDVLAIIL